MLERIHCETREEWLGQRTHSIGGSEAAAIIGKHPFMTNIMLYEYKCGLRAPPDLSNNSAVQFGIRAETPMRMLYQAQHPEITMEHYPFDILRQAERPWLTCTLDGEITEPDGRRGIWEGKTAELSKRVQWDKWKDAVPEHYYIQILWELLATGYDFAVLNALLKGLDGDCSLRTYRFERSAKEKDLEWLLGKGNSYWAENILARKPPNMILPGL